MYALKLASDGRVLSVMDERYKTKNTPIVSEFPADDTYDYRYINSEWIYDPLPKPTALPDRVIELEEALDLILSGETGEV